MKRLTKVTITADLWVEDILPEKAAKKVGKNFEDHVICKPYVGFSLHKITTTVLDVETGEPK